MVNGAPEEHAALALTENPPTPLVMGATSRAARPQGDAEKGGEGGGGGVGGDGGGHGGGRGPQPVAASPAPPAGHT